MDGRGTLDLLQDELLRCDICQEIMDTPKELPCLHNFCLSCIQRACSVSALGPGDAFACPTCRHESQIPENGINSLPTNFNLTRLMQIINERRKARRKKPPAQLVTALSSLQEIIVKAKETRDFLKKRYKEIHTRKQKCVSDIEARKNYLISLLKDYGSKMLENVETTYKSEMDELNRNLEILESQIYLLQKAGGIGRHDPKYSPIETLRHQLDRMTNFASNLSMLEGTIREVSRTPYAEFKPGIASTYVMEQVFGRLHVTSLAEVEREASERRAAMLVDIPEGNATTVINYFSCGSADDDAECYITDLEVLPSGEIVCIDADNHCAKVFFESGQPKLVFGKQILKRPDKLTSLSERANTTVQHTANQSNEKCKILISDLEEECILQFDQIGTFLSRFPSPVANPTALCASRDGNVLISDWKTKTIHIVSENGEHLHTFPTEMSWPVYLSASPNGNVVVSDWKSHQVRVFDTFGTRVRDYDHVGSGEGQLHRPNGVLCDRNNFIYVTDMKNCRVHLLSPLGKFVRFVATKDNGIRRPTGIRMNNKGDLLVADLKGTISILCINQQD